MTLISETTLTVRNLNSGLFHRIFFGTFNPQNLAHLSIITTLLQRHSLMCFQARSPPNGWETSSIPSSCLTLIHWIFILIQKLWYTPQISCGVSLAAPKLLASKTMFFLFSPMALVPLPAIIIESFHYRLHLLTWSRNDGPIWSPL